MNWRLILTETLRSIPGLIRNFRENRNKKRRDMVSLRAGSEKADKKMDELLDGLSDND